MTTMFTAKGWWKSNRRTTPIYVSVGRITGGVAVRIEFDAGEVNHTFPDVSDAQLFVLRTTKSQNLADWVALALPEAVGV